MKDPYLDYLTFNDQRRYTRFVTHYLDPMARLARRLVQPALADDVVQEAFLRLAKGKLCPVAIENPRSYILRTVYNVAKNLLREERTRSRHEKKAMRVRESLDGAEELIARESVRRVYEAIDRLEPDHRTAIHLRLISRGPRPSRDAGRAGVGRRRCRTAEWQPRSTCHPGRDG